MNTYTYSVSTPTQVSPGSALKVSYDIPTQLGSTELTINFNGIKQNLYKFLGFAVSWGDGSDTIFVANTSTAWQEMSAVQLTKVLPRYDFNSKYNTYTVNVSALKTNLKLDIYSLNVKLQKTSINTYGNLRPVNSVLFNRTATNDLYVSMELQDPSYIVAAMIPFDKSTDEIQELLVGATQIELPPPPLTGENILRTESSHLVGFNRIPITLEDTTAVYLCGADTYVTEENPLSTWPV